MQLMTSSGTTVGAWPLAARSSLGAAEYGSTVATHDGNLAFTAVERTDVAGEPSTVISPPPPPPIPPHSGAASNQPPPPPLPVFSFLHLLRTIPAMLVAWLFSQSTQLL